MRVSRACTQLLLDEYDTPPSCSPLRSPRRSTNCEIPGLVSQCLKATLNVTRLREFTDPHQLGDKTRIRGKRYKNRLGNVTWSKQSRNPSAWQRSIAT